MLRQMVRPAVHLVVGGPSLVASECRESGCCAGCIRGSSLKRLLLWRAVVTPVCAAVAPSSSQQPEPGTAAEQCQAVAWDAAVPYSTGSSPTCSTSVQHPANMSGDTQRKMARVLGPSAIHVGNLAGVSGSWLGPQPTLAALAV